jgi:hypothetical protein
MRPERIVGEGVADAFATLVDLNGPFGWPDAGYGKEQPFFRALDDAKEVPISGPEAAC